MKKIWLLFIFVLGFGLCHLHSQAYLDLIHSPDQNTTLQDIQVLAEAYFANRDKGRGSGYKQYKRWEYKMERQVNADGKIQNFSKLAWDVIEELSSTNPPVERSMANWSALGPTSYTNGANGYNGGLGRVNVIAFHPTNANIIYIGMPAGGVWKTTDGGTTWSPMADILASIGVSGIAVDHGTPNTIYILTGDGDAADTYSIGIMKSTDGGATWVTTGLSWSVNSFNRGYKLLMHPTNASIMFAVTTAGILKTTDGWATWSNVQGGSFRDIEFKPGAPATMYATTANAFFRSINTGSSWGAIGTGLPANENRAAIAVTPANSSYVYYLAGPGGIGGNGTYNGMYRSTDSGVSFSTMSTTPNILGNDINGGGTSDQSWYDLAIAVNPSNANNTITGGVNVWRSTNGGVANTLIAYWFSPGASQYVHADIHELVYNQVDGVLYCGSDGGISRSTDDGVTWTNIWNGLQIMQFYRIAGVETNQNLLYGGTQDNGTNKYTGSTTILHILGGDGMDCMIDYNNNNNVYYSFQNGGLQRSTNGGTSSTGIQPSGSTGAWVTPYGMDATNPSIIYGGYSDVYRSTNMGTSWSNLGSDGRGAFAVGVNDGTRLYAANGSAIQTSANTGGSWTTVTGSWPALTITFIAVDPANANRVWITLGGYTAGQKVYESTNAGGSWTNISGSLPNTPALSIAYENTGGTPMDAVYVGMGVGVYYRSDVTSWTLHDTGLPNVPVFDLQINHTNSKIRAGTYGRGLWETLLFGAPTCDVLSTNVTSTPPSCPGVNDGSITITATCSTCTNIRYIITPTAPPGAPIVQVGNGIFLNLSPNSYNVTVEDSADSSCNDTWATNPVVIPAGVDNTAPAITCPANVSVECGGDTSPTSTGTATATDACDSSPTVTFSDSSAANCGNTEVITRTWTATDASANSAICTQTITVIDTTSPSITCPANVTLECGDDTSPANTGTATGSDGCGTVAFTFSDVSVSGCGNTEVITRTWTATDPCTNTATCVQIITVLDTIDPVITCPVNITVNNDAGVCEAVVNYTAPSVSDNCGGVTASQTAGLASGSSFPVGTTTNTFEVTDACGNTASCSFDVTVNDTEDPIIVCPADQIVMTGAGNMYVIPDYFGTGAATATDNCTDPVVITTQSPAAGTQLAVGVYTVTLTAEDDSGNIGSCTFELTVELPLGMNDNSGLSTLLLYPNPGADYMILSNPENLELQDLSIYDISGRLIKTLYLLNMGAERSIDISKLQSTIYLVLIRGTRGQITKQFIKE